MKEEIEHQREIWNERAKAGLIRADIDPYDVKGVKVDYIDHWSKYYLRKYLNPTSEDIICEVGCGTGRLSNYFALQVKTLVGLDIAEKPLRIAMKIANNSNSVFINYDGENFPIKERSVDEMYTCWVLQHIRDKSILMNIAHEISRSLKPGSRICFIEQTAPKEFDVFIEKGFYKRVRNPQEYITLFEDNNFKLVSFKIINEKGYGLYYRFIARCGNRIPYFFIVFNPIGMWLDRLFSRRKLVEGRFTDCIFVFEKSGD